MENEQIEVETGEETSKEETKAGTTDSKVELTDEEKLARLRGGVKRLERKLGLSEPAVKKEEVKVENKKSDEGLLQKTYLRAAGIVAEDEVVLAVETAKKWGVEVDKLVDDDDFKVKLDKLRTSKANANATANIKGGGGGIEAKNTPEYWVSKGVPPTRDEVPNRKTRVKIARAMMANSKSGKKFYND